MKYLARITMASISIAYVAMVNPSNGATPYKLSGPLAIRSVAVPGNVGRFDVEEMKVDLTATYDNPFDPDDVALDADVTAPSGTVSRVPGFLYQAFNRQLASSGNEVVTAAGQPEWRVRYAPSEIGKYRIVLNLKDRTGQTTSKEYTFRSTRSRSPGFIHISKTDPHYFAYDTGGTYFPVGANICWSENRGTFDYDNWLPAFGNQGCNYTRLWLAPAHSRFTFATFLAGKAEDGLGYQCPDLGNAWKLDYTLDLARKNGINVMLCFENGGRGSAYHVDSGGIVSSFNDFWTNPDVARWYRAKMRYLVARYGADTNVFAWELWNEVDLVDKNVDAVKAWHARTAQELRAMDPYQHLITTSFSGWDGVKDIDMLPEMDYVQTHLYHLGDLAADVVERQHNKEAYGKPEYTGETGADWRGASQDDPRGEQIHQTLWASTVAGGSGAAAMWWWDNYIQPNKLWPVYRPLTKFIDGVDFGKEHMRSANVSFSSPDLIGWSTAGHHVVLTWVRLASAGWKAVCQDHVTLVPVSDGSVTVHGVEPGVWTADIWDTWNGTVIGSTKVTVASTGDASIALPTVDEDLGIKMHR